VMIATHTALRYTFTSWRNDDLPMARWSFCL